MSQTPFIVGISISSFFMLSIFGVWFYFWLKNKKNKNTLQKKGKTTEEFVSHQVNLWAYDNNGLYIPPTMFKYQGNKIFEVDGILITQRALISIEVKNINAKSIEGRGFEKEWFKVLGKEKYLIKSPILQNDKHLDHIYKLTNMKIPMVSLIIFDADSVENINITDVPQHVLIIKSSNIQATLDGINSMLLPKINQNEALAIYYKLMDHKTDSNEDKKLLISYAKEFNEKTFTI